MEQNNIMQENSKHPGGVEVKLSTKTITSRSISVFLMLLLFGTCLYIYVWEGFSAYNFGYQLGSIAKLSKNGTLVLGIGAVLLLHLLIQTGILYWFSGKDRKVLGFQLNMSGLGFYLKRPITLKYYRVALLLPGILLGILPTLHGFCIGNPSVFYLGMFGILVSSADFNFWYKLLPFDEEDLLITNKDFFSTTIIKRNYGKEHE